MDNDILVMLKVAERCNINCTYCYMYNGVDQSWKERPKLLSDEHLEEVIERLKDYHATHPEARMTLEIHGGEPLLMGKERMKDFLGSMRNVLSDDALFICTQTNGILLDVEWLEIFDNFQATVSISCDGPPDAHNAHRVGFNGGETSSAVEKAIKLCLDYPGNIFNGILAVVDPCFNGADTVRYFYGLGVRNMDFLLPDSNYVTPPLHITDYSHEKMDAFLKAAFDCWIAYQDPGFSIRIFETFIKGVLGKRSDLDAFGGDLSPILVVESDGSYRLLDVLAICEDGIAKTSLDVTTNSIDHFLEISRNAYPEHAAFCGACPAFTACGGGYLAHRFNGASYVNPSFYCPVLFSLYKYTVSYLQSVWIAATPAGLPDLPLLEGFKTVLMENYNSIIRPNAEMNVGR